MPSATINADSLDIEPADFSFSDEQLDALAALLIADADFHEVTSGGNQV